MPGSWGGGPGAPHGTPTETAAYPVRAEFCCRARWSPEGRKKPLLEVPLPGGVPSESPPEKW